MAYGVADYYFNNYTAPTGTWTHLSFVATPSGTLLYANGSLVDSNSATVTLPMTSLANGSGDLLNGAVDEVATFDRALLEGQLKTLYLTAIGDQNPPGFVNDVPITLLAGTLYATLPFTLSIDAYGAGPLAYAWRKNGSVIGNGATYRQAAASTADNGAYDVIVTNAHGAVTSAVVNISINPAVPAGIAQQPASRQAYAGGTAAFTVTASGTTPFTYQWKKGGTNITGATKQTLTITNVGAADPATYSVGVTNIAGGTVSAGASLTLRPVAAGSYEAAIVSSGPAAYWRLGETSGTTAFDYMGGHDAVYTNVTLGVPGYSASGPNTAVGFDPTNPNGPGLATIPDGSIFPFIGATLSFTLEAWVNWIDLTAVQRVFSYAGPGFHGIGFGLNTANGLRFTTYGVQD
jgi:Immunoglobulin I-set domain/Concanavalin A-like lectin/glucanases superfamily